MYFDKNLEPNQINNNNYFPFLWIKSMWPYGLICQGRASLYSGAPLAAWRRAHCSPLHLGNIFRGNWTNHRHHRRHWLHPPLPSRFQPKMFCFVQLNTGLLTILIKSSSLSWYLPSGEKSKIARTKMKNRILNPG